MIIVQVELFSKKGKEKVEIDIGSTISVLFKKLKLVGSENNFFYIINGSNKIKEYVLQDGDDIKIFPAMSGG